MLTLPPSTFTGERSTFRLLVQSHPPPSLHQRSLSRRVRSLQPVPEGGVLRVCEPVASVSLQCRKLPDQPRVIAGCVPRYILRFCGPIYSSLILCPKTVE
jgi:hypothetical protein